MLIQMLLCSWPRVLRKGIKNVLSRDWSVSCKTAKISLAGILLGSGGSGHWLLLLVVVRLGEVNMQRKNGFLVFSCLFGFHVRMDPHASTTFEPHSYQLPAHPRSAGYMVCTSLKVTLNSRLPASFWGHFCTVLHIEYGKQLTESW